MSACKIAWNRGDGEGYCTSKCGMFSITPLYMGCETAQAYEVYWNNPLHGMDKNHNVSRVKIASEDTMRDCKADCEDWLNTYIK